MKMFPLGNTKVHNVPFMMDAEIKIALTRKKAKSTTFFK